MDHWDKCVAHVTAHARALKVRNEWAVEGLLRSYLDQPAFYPEWREELLEIGLAARPAAANAEPK